MLDDLHAIRVRANLIERNVSGLRPEDEDGREWELWTETMALTGEQFHGIMLALRAAADAELGCGPTDAELEPVVADPRDEPDPRWGDDATELASLPSSDPPPARFVVSELESSSGSAPLWLALGLVAAVAIALAVALIMVTT
jgi:hypothetical protein